MVDGRWMFSRHAAGTPCFLCLLHHRKETCAEDEAMHAGMLSSYSRKEQPCGNHAKQKDVCFDVLISVAGDED